MKYRAITSLVVLIGVVAMMWLTMRQWRPGQSGRASGLQRPAADGEASVDLVGLGVTEVEAVLRGGGETITCVTCDGYSFNERTLLLKLPASVRQLIARNSTITADGLASASLPNLDTLDLSGCEIGDEIWPVLSKFPKLTRLVVSNTRVTGSGAQSQLIGKLQMLGMSSTLSI